MPSFTLGQPKASHLTIHIQKLLRGGGTTYVTVQVDLHIKIFEGSLSANYKTEFADYNINQLYADLQSLYTNLDGTVPFHTLEEQLEFEICGDGRGHFEVKGIAQEHRGSDNQLHFCFQFDQTFLLPTLKELQTVAEQITLE